MSLSKRNTATVCSILIAIATCGFTPKSNADIIHESATMGPASQYPGTWILDSQFLGSRFEITEPTEITAIGGHIGSENDLLIFGAIVSLDDQNDFPNGAPFWPIDVVAWTYFRPPWQSADLRTPLNFILQPGWYGLVFGAGEFGGLNDNAIAFMPGGGQASYPGSSYFHWNGSLQTWFNTAYSSGYPRFVVEGQPVIPPVEIYGTKFDDVDGNGVWDAGEPNMPGWEIYLDENGNGVYDASEPNVITDSGGMYRFTDLDTPVTYRVREVNRSGWTQTLPGAPDNNEYVINAEPNNIYGPCDFGNTDQPITKYGGGDGTPGNPYQIWTAIHMNQMGIHQEDWGSHFILMDDLDMSSITGEQYNIIGYRNSSTDYLLFTGTFDGNGKTIQNFNYQTSTDRAVIGLFGAVENAQIMDLTMTNVNIEVPLGSVIGGIAGYQSAGSITNCHVTATIEATSIAGGLVGFSYGTVNQCSSAGSIVSSENGEAIGGLIGLSRSNVNQCTSAGTVTALSSSRQIGGLIGHQMNGTVTDCYATGTVSAGITSNGVGGLLGILRGTASMLERCYSTGDVTAGENSISIGGLIGYFWSGNINSSFSTGNVSTTDAEGVGGLIGTSSFGIVRNCYSTANVSGNNQSNSVGGFAGAFWGEIFNSYCTGSVSTDPAGDFIGGFTGQSSGVVNSFWDAQTSGLAYGGGGKPRSTDQMQKAANYINWNTVDETNWVIDEGVDYPHLAWEGTTGINLSSQMITDFLDGQGTQAEPFLIGDANDLNIIGLFHDQWDKDYLLVSDIDLSVLGGNEFNIIGIYSIPFSGTFDGDGYWIDHFSYTTGYESNLGLFRAISGMVNNVAIEDMAISAAGGDSIGGLTAYITPSGIVNNCYVEGNISMGNDSSAIGGLAGGSDGIINDCDTIVQIIAGHHTGNVGGLIGFAYSDQAITRCSSIASITTGNDSDSVGALIGRLGGSLTQSFSNGTVTAGDDSRRIGGLVGYSSTGSELTNCYSKADVTGGSNCQFLGGLAGAAWGDIDYCYSMGSVAGGEFSEKVGGLVGSASSSLNAYRSYWDKQTSGQATSFTGTGLNTEQMLERSSYQFWDFLNTWRICDGMNYPRLQWEPKPVGDFVCPEGVELADLLLLSEEWLAAVPLPSVDIAPYGSPDGKANLLDYSIIAENWLLGVD